MKILFNFILLMVGLSGAAIGLLSDITVDSSVQMINGMEFSLMLGVFSFIVIINAVVGIFSTN